MKELRRISIIVSGDGVPDRDWNCEGLNDTHLVFLRHSRGLPAFLDAAGRMDVEIDRILVDQGRDTPEFLQMMASLPVDYRGDLVWIREGVSSYLSATGRGSGRLLYELDATDVRFYLEANELVSGRTEIMPALARVA